MFGESIILAKYFVNRSIKPTEEGCRARKLASRTGVTQKRRDHQVRCGEDDHASASEKHGWRFRDCRNSPPAPQICRSMMAEPGGQIDLFLLFSFQRFLLFW